MTRKGIIAGLTSFCTRFRRDRRGVTALEFGLVGPLFIVLLCGILENGLILLTQTLLDNATRVASRQILIGTTTSSQFSAALCNNVSSFIPCASIKFNVQSGASFGALNGTLQTDASGNMINTQYSPGVMGQFVLVQVGYNRPFMIPYVGIFSGVNSELIVSTIAFKSEPY